jgi:hypothetical protein
MRMLTEIVKLRPNLVLLLENCKLESIQNLSENLDFRP